MRALFRDRDARLLLVGQALSLFGDRAMYLVLGIWVKTLTGSNAQAGLVFFVLALPGPRRARVRARSSTGCASGRS